jgi:hypothetical protein
MAHAERVWQLVGTFLPIIGIVLTIFVAVILKGWQRWASMVVIPLLVFAVCAHYGKFLATDGNLLFVAISMFYATLLSVYYPVLICVGFYRWFQNRRNGGES